MQEPGTETQLEETDVREVERWPIIAPETFASPSAAAPLWRGFDSPTFAAWDQTQVQDSRTGSTISKTPEMANSVMSVRPVADPALRHFGEPYNFYVTVRKRTDGVSRSELVHFPKNGSKDGQQYFYRWSTWFPKEDAQGKKLFPIGPGERGVWQVFTQWHQASDQGSPPIAFSVKNKNKKPYIGLEFDGNEPSWTVPFEYNEWHNFVVRVKFSNKTKDGHPVGEVELWYSTGTDLPQPMGSWNVMTTATKGSQRPYLKHGLYRSQKYYGERVSYLVHSGMMEGLTLASVFPCS
ncbi:heparin lyase I family protein [Corallococcus sp. AS-1-6]|uniref:heparin lyase I family protein n=1 Tax=Corallococcus sp. AS-1-6 TaxID=2874599 RepID=UPI001CBBD863|nr:heparin lyase I family protein [Corallococcus sp. AS-1-6]MBZ4371440.1 polysaccharide lyase [Corallococcus sp. AS-1-6]